MENLTEEIVFYFIKSRLIANYKKLGNEYLLKVKEKILKAISDCPNVLTYQDELGNNVGMYATFNPNFEDIAILALDNHEASLQQNNNGNNIGMLAARHELEEATLKALDNYEASKQVNKYNGTIVSILKNNSPDLFYKFVSENKIFPENNMKK